MKLNEDVSDMDVGKQGIMMREEIRQAVRDYDLRRKQKRKEMMILAGTIKDEINRMCIANKLSELGTAYVQAKRNLEKLSKMIYDEYFKPNAKDIEIINDHCILCDSLKVMRLLAEWQRDEQTERKEQEND